MFGRKKRKGESETGLEPGADHVMSEARLTPLDIQQQEFRLAFRGYNEKDVDEFLDRVTEEFARLLDEVKALRERGVATGSAAADAESIRAKAREEAAAILRDARARAAVMGGERTAPSGGPPPGVGPFLQAEREFLHRLGGMIKEHAESITAMAHQMARGAAAGSGGAADRGATPPTDEGRERPLPPEELGSAWSATGPSGETGGTGGQREIVSIPPSQVDTRMKAPQGIGKDHEERQEPEEQRSLRELFWGEE